MSIEIYALKANVPVKPKRKLHEHETATVEVEIFGSSMKIRHYDSCGEWYDFNRKRSPFGYVLVDDPHFREVYRHLAEYYASNRGKPVGEFLKAAVDAMENALADRHGPSCVYFAQAGDKVKIGWSRKVAARLAKLQTGNPAPIKLLGVTSGGPAREQEIHRQFAHCRVSGEWFEATPELLAYIGSAT